MAAPQQPALMDELVEECLLRLPPDDPANLFRATLVCKGWRRIVTHRAFRRRFRELHGRPLVLGFLHILTRYGSFFTPTFSFHPRDINAYLRLGGWHAIDSRHGRVLLSSSPSLRGTDHMSRRSDLAVWDSVLGDRLDLPELPPPQHSGWFDFTSKAAVFCASSSPCDHLDCHRGHFFVFLVDVTKYEVKVYLYSSQAGAWSHETSAAKVPNHGYLHHWQPVTMAENMLYFIVQKWTTNGILKYDMGANEVSWVDIPPDCSSLICRILLTTTEQGGLGIVRVEKNSMLLRLWSREAGHNGVLGWALSGVIELETVLSANSGSVFTVSFVHELCAFFITTNHGAFTVDLLSNRVRRVVSGNSNVNYLVPYTSLCTPGAVPLLGRNQLLVCQIKCMKNLSSWCKNESVYQISKVAYVVWNRGRELFYS